MSTIGPGGIIPPTPPRPTAPGQAGIGNSEMEAERDADGRHLPMDQERPADDEAEDDPTDDPQDTGPRRRSHDPTGQRGGRLDIDC